MKFLDQLGDAVKDVKELAKSKASVVKDLTAEKQSLQMWQKI